MNDEYIKNKYRNLYRNMYNIKNQLYQLNTLYNDLKVQLKNSILLDHEIPELERMNKMQNDIVSISKEIDNTIIPRINSKL